MPVRGPTCAWLVIASLAVLGVVGCGSGGTSGDGVFRAQVGSAGALLDVGGGTALDIPAGALSTPQTIEVSTRSVATPPAGMAFAGPVWSLEPAGLAFAKAATLALPTSGLPAGAAVRIATYDRSNGTWIELPGSIPGDGLVTAPIVHFSLYAPVVREGGEGEGGRIVGHVSDGEHPIAHALVTIAAGPGDTAGRHVYTGENGGFELESLPAGEYALDVSATGFEPGHKSGIIVVSHQATEIHIILSQLGQATGAIAGVVRDLDGHPLANATVAVVTGPTAGESARTTLSGEYVLDGLLPGVYSVRASLEGYEPDAEDGIEVASGATTERNLHLTRSGGGERFGWIVGRVRDALGVPIAGALVRTTAGPLVGRSAVTDEGGHYELASLLAGEYEVRATKDGYQPQAREATVVGGQGTEVNFELVADPPVEERGRLVGHVRTLEGQPLAGATVAALEGPSAGARATTNGDGYYVIENLLPGGYLFEATKEGWQAAREDVTITASHTSERNFALSPEEADPGWIVGWVRDGEGRAIAGASVEIVDGPTTRSTTTNEDGHYELPELEPGGYRLTASKEGYESATRECTVESGSGTECNFELIAAARARLWGLVRNGDGNAIVEARVEILDGPSEGGDWTNGEGEYVIEDLLAGAYRVRASKEGFESATLEVTLESGGNTRLDFDL